MIRPNSTPSRLVLTAACLGLAACGSTKTADIPSGGSGEATAAASATIERPTTTNAKPTFAKPTAEIKKIAAAVGTSTKKKPKIIKPSGKPPAQLTVVDIVKGKGAGAKNGDSLTVDYAGDSWSTGKEFDASWKRGQPFPLTLGQGAVIKGWDEGLVGMKQGGRRLLVIPPDLGYGSSGSGTAIKPNETLVFVVDLRRKG